MDKISIDSQINTLKDKNTIHSVLKKDSLPAINKVITKRTQPSRTSTKTTPQIIKDKKKIQNKHYITKKDFQKLSQIPEIPRIYPSEEEYNSPLELLSRLNSEGYPSKYGAVIIVAPKSFIHKLNAYPDDTQIKTRTQRLIDLKKGEPFEEDNKYTVQSFKEYSQSLSSSYQYLFSKESNSQPILLKNEIEYWNLIQNYKHDISIDYAADLPASKHGSYFQQDQEGFNLSKLFSQKDSLFQFINKKSQHINGVTYPWVYFGALFSSFCWHVEDNFLYALNYQHSGQPKTWYFIPQSETGSFKSFLKRTYQRKNKMLQELTLQINPIELMNAGVRVYKVYQQPGEVVINFPNCYHAGFNNGYNINEAVNIATPDWLSFGQHSVSLFRQGMVKQIVFPHEYILYQIAQGVQDYQFCQPSLQIFCNNFMQMIQSERKSRQEIISKYPNIKEEQIRCDLDRYDQYKCQKCKYYCQLSFIQCRQCNVKSCLLDNRQCSCAVFNLVMNILVSLKNLETMKDKIQLVLNKE